MEYFQKKNWEQEFGMVDDVQMGIQSVLHY
jgi:hypothetical protein